MSSVKRKRNGSKEDSGKKPKHDHVFIRNAPIEKRLDVVESKTKRPKSNKRVVRTNFIENKIQAIIELADGIYKEIVNEIEENE